MEGRDFSVTCLYLSVLHGEYNLLTLYCRESLGAAVYPLVDDQMESSAWGALLKRQPKQDKKSHLKNSLISAYSVEASIV